MTVKALIFKAICILSLLGVLVSIYYSRYTLVANKSTHFKKGDYVMIDPSHMLGRVVSVNGHNDIKVIYTNGINVVKEVIIAENKLHKVIFVDNFKP